MPAVGSRCGPRRQHPVGLRADAESPMGIPEPALTAILESNHGHICEFGMKRSTPDASTAIGYAPDLPAAAWNAAAQDGILIARTPKEPIAMKREPR